MTSRSPGSRRNSVSQRDLRLQPRERCAEAVVGTASEGEVARVLAPHVEPVGIVEAIGVAVGGIHDGDHQLAAS